MVNLELRFWWSLVDMLVSGKDVLMMGANSAVMSYKGVETIDDVDMDVFNGCLYVTDTDMTINATYYFTCKCHY